MFFFQYIFLLITTFIFSNKVQVRYVYVWKQWRQIVNERRKCSSSGWTAIDWYLDMYRGPGFWVTFYHLNNDIFCDMLFHNRAHFWDFVVWLQLYTMWLSYLHTSDMDIDYRLTLGHAAGIGFRLPRCYGYKYAVYGFTTLEVATWIDLCRRFQ